MTEDAILILHDDTPEIGELHRRLAEAGYKVRLCLSSRQALEVVRAEKIVLLVAAGNFPELTGMELAEKIYEVSTIPTFLVLNAAGDETRTWLHKHPAIIGIFYRPLNIEKLIEKIERFLENA